MDCQTSLAFGKRTGRQYFPRGSFAIISKEPFVRAKILSHGGTSFRYSFDPDLAQEKCDPDLVRNMIDDDMVQEVLGRRLSPIVLDGNGLIDLQSIDQNMVQFVLDRTLHRGPFRKTESTSY